MLFQPGLDLALGLHAFLQLLERGQTGFELGDLRAFGLHALLSLAPRAVEPRQRVLGVLQAGLGFLLDRLMLGQLRAHRFEQG